MTDTVIIDAGPALNFSATNNERLLLSVLSPLTAPETVADEVARKGKSARFKAAPGVWKKLVQAKRLTVLSDDSTPDLEAASERIATMPLGDRKKDSRDLGETLVVIHAAVLADVGGHDVVILIDDQGGAELAAREIRRIERRRAAGHPTGTIRLVNTPLVLDTAIRRGLIASKQDLRKIYTELRACDDGLIDIGQTSLLSRPPWP
ncbi:hypothetical protein N802_16475 [Knoellia sinensis KCTC 19936]|uniref:PIN domain-containing protein n=1 Tax=Knoellia sinensis KCTC 19936 TaxID=1385520 RepID=A0A0A0J6K8_9MICO|nr:hypothetical protein [Knoellia sinensis]KGN32970.1 hypothetical protein N802_16475 [Knoellia sinensis KCTC 19936]